MGAELSVPFHTKPQRLRDRRSSARPHSCSKAIDAPLYDGRIRGDVTERKRIPGINVWRMDKHGRRGSWLEPQAHEVFPTPVAFTSAHIAFRRHRTTSFSDLCRPG